MRTIGSLCSGYGGLDSALPGTVAYVCDPEPAAALVLNAHYPDAPNHHDLKALAWARTPVDVLTAGYPCTPFSGAGKRKGTDDPRHLWPWIAQGIGLSRPPLIFLENVRGHLSLGWDTVLLHLHELGYDVRWTLLRAADVGAPHGRARVFAVCADRDSHRWEPSSRRPVARIETGVLVEPEAGLFGSHPLPPGPNGHVPMWPAGLMVNGVVWEQQALLGEPRYQLLPTPTTDPASYNGHARNLGTEALLLPTPRTTDANGAGEHGIGGLDLRTAVDLLPTPLAADAGTKRGSSSGNGLRNESKRMGADGSRWGRYAAAVARCEALTRPAPDPTEPTGKKSAQRLSPRFVEWIMMLPDGWVTGHELKRDAQLKLLGNGCVPAQAQVACGHLTVGLLARQVAA